MKLTRHVARIFDKKPWAAHLYVTDRCNLDCHYCNEYDNSRPHPKLEDLKTWMRQIRSLGVARIGLQGGEPLMHPDITEVVRFARELGFDPVSMASNGFLLTRELLGELERAGLHSLSLSVDRMTPIPTTRKSFKTVASKLEWFQDSPVRLTVSGVLFDDTLDEMAELLEECLGRGISAHARVVHDDLVHQRAMRTQTPVDRLEAFIQEQARLKRSGAKIHTSWPILEYQLRMLRGQPQEWRCVAGYKYFFVSAEGRFWPCSQVRTDRHILEITPEDLLAYDRKKECQTNCGVYCTVDASLAVGQTSRYLWSEARGRIQSGLSRLWSAESRPFVFGSPGS